MNEQLRIERLTMAHRDAVERFERENRAFFASHVSDRGDDYFEHFSERLATLVSENEAGRSLFFVLVEDGGVVGRVNITDIDQPERTELGFRLAENARGRGVATAGVTMALDQAAALGVRSVRARAATVNLGSQKVLQRCGFRETGPAERPEGSSLSFVGYRRDLTA